MSESDVARAPRLVELLGVFARAGDLGRGQPEGHVERVCWIGMRIADHLVLTAADRVDVYFTTLLIHAGCTAGIPEFAAFVASDELTAQRDTCLCDPQNLVQVLGWMKRNVDPQAPVPRRMQKVLQMNFQGEKLMSNAGNGCADVGSRVAARLGLPPGAVTALGKVCETWNGKGPQHLKGSAIPLASRVAQAAMLAEVFHREGGRDLATEAIGRRAGKSLDPQIAQAFLSIGRASDFWSELQKDSLLDAILALEPDGPRTVDGPGLDSVALAFADFVDLKSTRTAAHSRATAELAERMAGALGAGEDEVALCRRAGLVHDLGQIGVPALVLEKAAPGPAERAQIELHPQFGERLLSRVPALRDIAAVVAAHHERLDGSGFPHGLTGERLSLAARIVAVADEYDELLRGTHGRAPMTPEEAYASVAAAAGARLDGDCVRALRESRATPVVGPAESPPPSGLTEREVEVVRLAARGLTLKEIARDLSLSTHTARHHLEHVYEKIGVSSRAGVTLFAVENRLLT